VDIASIDDLPIVVRKAYAAIPRSVRIGLDEAPVEVRLGVAVFPRDGQTAEELIRNASIAANNASPAQGDEIFFYSGSGGSQPTR